VIVVARTIIILIIVT